MWPCDVTPYCVLEKFVTAAQAVSEIASDSRIYLHGMAAAPTVLINALCGREDLRNVEIVCLHTEGAAPYAQTEMRGRFRVNALFVGPNVRAAVNEGRGDYTPVFLSEVP